LQRGAELDQRAAQFRQQEERRKALKRKREEKERKEREARRQLGVGLATQMVGYSHTQARLKSGMEAFVGLQKKRKAEDDQKEREVRRKLDVVAEVVERDPWDDVEEFGVEDLDTELPSLDTRKADSFVDDDVDDETLLEVHNQIMSDPAEEALEEAPERTVQHPPRLGPSIASIPQIPSQDSADCRLHGPINQALEKALEQLPDPLIELLSTDCSKNRSWAPASSLLHRLNPVGLPPHRLRLKLGCVVTLLQNLEVLAVSDDGTSRMITLLQGNYLQVFQVEHDHIKCLVRDGPMEGSKAVLIQKAFEAKYKNDDQFPFRRVQFPIRVCAKQDTPRHRSPSHIEPAPTIPAKQTLLKKGLTPPRAFKKPELPVSRKPASGAIKKPTPMESKSAKPPVETIVHATTESVTLVDWDDFLVSGTQIARELNSDRQPGLPVQRPMKSPAETKPCPKQQSFPKRPINKPESMPGSATVKPPSMGPPPRPLQQSKPSVPSKSITTNSSMGPPRPLRSQPPSRSLQPAPVANKRSVQPQTKPTLKPGKPIPLSLPKPKPESKLAPSFSDLGFDMSTQEAVSFFDDDEFSSSPTISV
jgi:hypothetical protein